MPIEAFRHKIFADEPKVQEILATENVREHLCVLAEELFRKENQIGSGNFSQVYRDTGSGIAYKKMKMNERPKNNVFEECAFLEKVHTIQDDYVRVPFPIASFVADIKPDNFPRVVRQSVLLMEEINGTSLDKFLPKEPGLEPLMRFPEGFNPAEFFGRLKVFIEKMHALGIYHRDVFTRNIMIEQETGNPILIDFGDAVEYDERFTEVGDFDAYGRKYIEGTIREDVDLKRLSMAQEEVERYLTK
jgi:serine/threonine protein kinase